MRSVFKNDSFAQASGSDEDNNGYGADADSNNIFQKDSVFGDADNNQNKKKVNNRDKILLQQFPFGPFEETKVSSD